MHRVQVADLLIQTLIELYGAKMSGSQATLLKSVSDCLVGDIHTSGLLQVNL